MHVHVHVHHRGWCRHCVSRLIFRIFVQSLYVHSLSLFPSACFSYPSFLSLSLPSSFTFSPLQIFQIFQRLYSLSTPLFVSLIHPFSLSLPPFLFHTSSNISNFLKSTFSLYPSAYLSILSLPLTSSNSLKSYLLSSSIKYTTPLHFVSVQR